MKPLPHLYSHCIINLTSAQADRLLPVTLRPLGHYTFYIGLASPPPQNVRHSYVSVPLTVSIFSHKTLHIRRSIRGHPLLRRFCYPSSLSFYCRPLSCFIILFSGFAVKQTENSGNGVNWFHLESNKRLFDGNFIVHHRIVCEFFLANYGITVCNLHCLPTRCMP